LLFRDGRRVRFSGSAIGRVGGIGPSNAFGDGASYDPARDAWTPIGASAAPRATSTLRRGPEIE
jgi:hypothetical protein